MGEQAASIVEWLVLTIVVLATITLGVEEEVEPEIDLEISNLSGTMILSTRESMDALGLDDYDRGAIATINTRGELDMNEDNRIDLKELNLASFSMSNEFRRFDEWQVFVEMGYQSVVNIQFT